MACDMNDAARYACGALNPSWRSAGRRSCEGACAALEPDSLADGTSPCATPSKSARAGEAGGTSGSDFTLTRARHREGANPNGASEASQPRGQLQADARSSSGTNPRCSASKHPKSRCGSSPPKFSSTSVESASSRFWVPLTQRRGGEMPTESFAETAGQASATTGVCKPHAPGEGDEDGDAEHATVLKTAEPDGDVKRDMEIDEEIETNEAEAKATAGVGLERRPRAPALPRTPRGALTPPTDEPFGEEEWANMTPTHLSRERDRKVESGADMPSGATAGKRACEVAEHGAAPEPPFTLEDPGEKVGRACGQGQ